MTDNKVVEDDEDGDETRKKDCLVHSLMCLFGGLVKTLFVSYVESNLPSLIENLFMIDVHIQHFFML